MQSVFLVGCIAHHPAAIGRRIGLHLLHPFLARLLQFVLGGHDERCVTYFRTVPAYEYKLVACSRTQHRVGQFASVILIGHQFVHIRRQFLAVQRLSFGAEDAAELQSVQPSVLKQYPQFFTGQDIFFVEHKSAGVGHVVECLRNGVVRMVGRLVLHGRGIRPHLSHHTFRMRIDVIEHHYLFHRFRLTHSRKGIDVRSTLRQHQPALHHPVHHRRIPGLPVILGQVSFRTEHIQTGGKPVLRVRTQHFRYVPPYLEADRRAVLQLAEVDDIIRHPTLAFPLLRHGEESIQYTEVAVRHQPRLVLYALIDSERVLLSVIRIPQRFQVAQHEAQLHIQRSRQVPGCLLSARFGHVFKQLVLPFPVPGIQRQLVVVASRLCIVGRILRLHCFVPSVVRPHIAARAKVYHPVQRKLQHDAVALHQFEFPHTPLGYILPRQQHGALYVSYLDHASVSIGSLFIQPDFPPSALR